MRHKKLVWFAALVALANAGQVFALDPAASQSYCNAVKQAALDAQQQYLKTYTPLKDPQSTFDDATKGCMSGILDISLPVPQTLDSILQQLEKQLIQRSCAAVHQQYQEAVSRAQQVINTQAPDVGLDVGLGSSASGTTGFGVNTSTSNPIGRVVLGANGVPEVVK